MFRIKKRTWNVINQWKSNNDDIVWVIGDVSLKHLGRKILGTKYILHMLELCETIPYYHSLPIFKMDATKYSNSAYKMVVSEYNRAHITKAWWNVDRLPAVLPNKPYNDHSYSKNEKITKSDEAKNVIDKLKGKKIILYQGLITKERPLDEYIKAVSDLGDDYAFVIMSNGEDTYKHLGSNNYYFIPFVAPPYHLQITSHAHIGVLSYVPTPNQSSILNAVYCAPNKLFEYASFGIPMISNDVPALKYEFDTKKCGIAVKNLTKKEIYESILKIEERYEEFSKNSKKLYKSVDIKEKIAEILK